jgi:MerR family transcriptional regulator/heat shock protein HspR
MTAELGLNLAGVERVLELEAQVERLRRRGEQLERQNAELRARNEELERRLRGQLVPYRRGDNIPVQRGDGPRRPGPAGR